MNNKIDLSIIIVSYKSKDHLAVLLPSIFASKGINFDGGVARPIHWADSSRQKTADKSARYTAEVIVVDNGSNDGTVEFVNRYMSDSKNNGRYFYYQVIQNVNSGFAAGNNIGIKKSSGKYILLLNPDTKLEPDTLYTMLDFMEARPEVGIAGPKIIKPNGKLDLACRRRFPNPWNSFQRLFLHDNTNYNYSDVDENQSMEVDSVVGAFLLIRRPVMEKIGMLDESFFMYGEDLDWCWRCKEVGFKVWYCPKTFITHFKGASSRKAPFRALKWFHDAMWIFYKKHYAAGHIFIFNRLVFLGIYGRLSALTILNLFKREKRVSK